MEHLTRHQFARMVDMVELAPATTRDTVDNLIQDACENDFHSIGTPYCYHPYVIGKIRERGMYDRIAVLGGGGFADGNWPEAVKLFSIAQCLEQGCREIDLTSNLGYIKSGMWKEYSGEIRRVRNLTRGRILKVIVHAPQLEAEELKRVCGILLEEDVDFVKTDTGRSPSPSTPEQVQIIRSYVGNRVKIKASGGIRTVDDVIRMVDAGADRLGMSRFAAMGVFAELPEA